jgi:hypothetical protein
MKKTLIVVLLLAGLAGIAYTVSSIDLVATIKHMHGG